MSPVLAFLLSLHASAAPAEAPEAGNERIRALLLDLSSHNVDEGTTRTIQSLVAVELQHYDALSVLTSEDIKRSLELEEARIALGCDEVSCLAEVAGALGAEIVLYGDIGKLDETLILNLSLFDTGGMESIGRVSVQVTSRKKLPAALSARMRDLLAPFYASRGLPLPEARSVRGAGLDDGAGMLPWVVVSSGVIGLALGGIGVFVGSLPMQGFYDAETRLQELAKSPSLDPDLARKLHEQREEHRADWEMWGLPVVIGGAALAAVGVAAVGGGLVWALSGDVE